ncbi:hypothetical protein XELAEV_18004644mg [Xenopus laevis]|uniref:G-protein coupled receptors family 3 profile domain-containing protein n=1 Tax=Xenopus laevis TaxID=8355 RepID=A0A974BRF9_XENLA|nr:hypothetical protein XELAEV_18004644mg [Xenopus laevis]
MLGAIALSLFLLKLKYLVGLIVIICKFPIVFVDPACRLSIIEAYEEYEYIHEGDVTIGGILTVNSFIIPFTESDEGPDSLMCVSAMLQFYRQLVDFIFAIEKINNDPILLANVTLGYHIYDSCGDPRKAVRSVFQILSGTREPVPNYSCVGKRNIAGFIGDLTSDTTVPIAQILSLFGYAQISYGATGSLLSNRVAFPYFFRTVESDNSHYFALSKLLKYFGWTWVGIIIFSENNEDLKLLSHHLSNNGICVEFHIKIHNYNTDVNYEPYKEIIQNSLTSVIVFCGTASMHMIGGLSLLSDAFSTKTIIVSFTVAANSQILDYAPKLFMGCLGLLQYFSYSLDSPERRLFLETIYPLKYPKDKLLENIWIRYYSCLSEDQDKNTLFAKIYKHKLQNCTGWERISHLHQFDNKFYSPRVLLSVNTMSRALHDIHVSHSKQALTSKIVYKFQLHYYLRNILYDIHEDKTSVFVENGEPISQYLIYNCLLDMDGRIAVTNVGLFIPWAPSDQKMHKGSIRWKTNNSQIPRSQCSDSCLPGYRKAPRGRTKACCYDCVPCSEGEISNITGMANITFSGFRPYLLTKHSENCIRCPDMEWPTNKKRWCTAKRIEFLSYSEDVISVLYLMFSAILFLITVLVLGIFIKYQDSPIVRANNRSLSFLLLVSIKLSFLSVFLFLGRPVDITCMLRNITFGITFSIAVSSLLAKTIMVYVAFKATKPGSSWRKWVGVKLSNSVVLFCSSIQIIICMTWLAISPPFQELDLHTYPGTIIIQCNEGSAIGFYSVIGYMGLLAAVSFVLAFLARTLPDSFNEAKYITFSMLLFCSVWITMIPAYLSTKGKNTPNPGSPLSLCATDCCWDNPSIVGLKSFETFDSKDLIVQSNDYSFDRSIELFALKSFDFDIRSRRILIPSRISRKINNDPVLLANVTLGYHIYDSCGDPRKAVRSVFQILSGTREPVPNYSCVGKRNIAGFIGDLTLDTTVPIAQILSLFGYAQISYGATGSLLSNRVAFPYFFRTVESDNSHYFALSKLLKYFGWTWVGIIIFSENNEDLKLLSHHLSNNGICVEFHIKIHNYNTDVKYEPYKEIIQNSLTSVIVFCGTASMHMIGGLGLQSDAFSTKTIIVSFTVAANSHILDYAPKLFMGCLGLLQYFSYSLDSPERRLFLETIYPLKYPKDKLLENIWIRYYSCLSEDQDKNTFFERIYKRKLQNCTGWERISHLHQFDNKFYSPRVLLAVNMMSRALHDIHFSHSNQALTSKMVYKFQLQYYLRNILYDIHEDKTSVYVENGEHVSQYLIYNCLLDMDGRIAVTNVGLFIPWAPSDQKMHKGSIRWKTNNSQIPRSQCSDSCLPGYRKAPRGRTKACCYDCVPCSEGEISNITGMANITFSGFRPYLLTKHSENCIRCPDMEWPTKKKRWCTAKKIEFLSYSDDVISVLYLMFSAILFLITVLVLGIFIKYQDTPIVRANNSSLSFLLLVSIKLSFLSVFLFLGRPVDITCMLRNITFGITFSIAVSSLLAKTIMVYVAFKATKPGSSWRKWVGVKLSNSVVLFCSSIQIIICMTWLAISPPFQELDLHTYPGTIIIQCNEGSAIGFYSVIGYMGLLAAVSFVLAFLARTLPDSFNEAKYITFSMLLFCSVWITMIPAYLSTKGKNTVCVEIFAILTSSAGLLFCIFLPKCFIILFRPERNIKSTMLGRKTLISM